MVDVVSSRMTDTMLTIKSLTTFGIAWIATATSWLRNDEFFINFQAMQQSLNG